eukprot:11173521-Lingulodinium_polyedra.AAC.1
MAHGRLRLSDATRTAVEPQVDHVEGAAIGFVEAVIASDAFKTGATKRRRRREVPLVASSAGLL